MVTGDGSGPKQRRTRQQFLKYCFDFIEKRNRSCQNGNLTPSSSTCSVNIGKEGVSCGRKRKMAVSEDDKRKMGKWSEDARKLRKGKKKVDNGRKSKFSPGTCESIMERIFVEEIPNDDSEDDSDDVVIIEEEGVNNESGSGWWSNTGLKSNMLNAKDQEVVSSTSSMCGRTPGKSEEVDTDSTSSSESESDSEASSDEDNDDPEDKNYRLIESSSSSQYDDVIRDGSGPKQRRTRQQFLKCCVDFTEKRNRSCQNGNLTPSSSTCSVNIGKEGVSCGRKRKMAVSEGDKRKMGKWSEDARKLRKGKKKVDNGRRSKFSPGTCESIMERIFVEEIPDDDVTDDSEDDSDDVDIIEEEEGVNNESGSGWWSNTGLKSNMLNAKDQEVVSSTSSMCGRTPVKSVEVYTDSTSSSESEFESDSKASSDEDNDDPEDKNYRLIESSSSSQYDDVISDFDDTESEDEKNEEGEKESNEGLVPELVVESEKQKKGGANVLRARSLSKSKKKKLNNGNDSSSPILLTDEEEFDDSGVGSDGEESKSEEECEVDDSVKNVVQKDVVRKDRRTGKKILEDSEFMKFVVDSIINVDDHDKLTPFLAQM
uniref:Surface protein SdrI from Staphylococcus saprophyticus n=1 Tax=Solanum tuberosum TaxID=4113 RepID=M1A8T5_SOLTU